MLTTLVMTVISADAPGLVRTLASTVASNRGNWLESRMCRLGGQFTGLIRVEIEAADAPALTDALQALAAVGLRISLHLEDAPPSPLPSSGAAASLDLIGQDQPGILRQITAIIASHHINIEELTTERRPAPLEGGTLFHARASLLVPPTTSLPLVTRDLEKIATDLMVEIKLSPTT